MNFGNGHNEFSDIPGFDASKGERILKALQKLWKKIEYLEQIRISEKKSSSKAIQVNSKDEDVTLTDVQYKLLVLQLQYARSILRKKLVKNDAVSHSKVDEVDQGPYAPARHYRRKNEHASNFESNAVSQETQTGESLSELYKGSGISEDATKFDVQVSTDDQIFNLKKNHPENLPSVSSKTLNSRPHYHLKLDDVPFILGASSTASHSVVANVQNIIAMMKSHNKALCGRKNPTGTDIQTASKNINVSSSQLHRIQLDPEKLDKKYTATEKWDSNTFKNFQKSDEVNRILHVKHIAAPSFRRLRSNSESDVKLHAEVKDISKRKKSDFVKCNIQPKQNTLNVRHQSSNLSTADRRKLLRSLKNFKTYLSEEDISWD